MATIGILPASGKASRIGGIPKFCLPISDEQSLIQWHVDQMLEVCDEVRVSTRSSWIPIIQSMNMNIKLIALEPSTMSHAVKFLIGDYNDTVIVGMPDTYINKANNNIYKEMLSSRGDLVLGTWDCTDDIKGRVGQVLLSDNKVIASMDKDINCTYPHIWGTMLFRKNLVRYIDPELDHPGKQIQEWIDMNLDVRAVHAGGRYMDIGTLSGLKQLYKEMDTKEHYE
jgi:hypothetical protein